MTFLTTVGRPISVAVGDDIVNDTIRLSSATPGDYTRHFTTDEQLFLKLTTPFTVPSLPIHHDVRRPEPEPVYLELIRTVVKEITPAVPEVLAGLCYFFDPLDIGRPSFYRIIERENALFLYLVRLDLRFRPAAHEVLEGGSNDRAPTYRTDELIMETDLLCVEEIDPEGRPVVQEVFSETWVGETGRGYFVQGIWIDRDLTRFLSALVTPPGHRLYPYFPVNCKYRSLCLSPVEFTGPALDLSIGLLAEMYKAVAPYAREIEAALKEQDYDPSMPLLQRIREGLPQTLCEPWRRFTTTPYLNDRDMREFSLDIS